MNQLFENVDVSGIIAPGDCWVMTSVPSDGQDVILDDLDLIQRDEDILPALDMVVCIVMEEYLVLLAFLGWERVSENSYVFRMRCYDKEEEKEVNHEQYLHRLPSFSERLAETKAIFGRF